MKRAGFKTAFARPKGARGEMRRQEETGRLLAAAGALHERFGALCTFLLYTGCRLTEALALRPADLHINEAFRLCSENKERPPAPSALAAGRGGGAGECRAR
jgi:integrase